MSFGGTVADLTALDAIDMSTAAEGGGAVTWEVPVFVVSKGTQYLYDPDYAGPANNEVTRKAGGTGTGYWHATGTIKAASTPSGYSLYPLIAITVIQGSAGSDTWYGNPGDASTWRQLS